MFKGLGFHAYPYPPQRGSRDARCCEDCNDRFVSPVRVLFGQNAAPTTLQLLAAIAKEGRFIRERLSVSKQMFDAAHAVEDEPDPA